MLKPDISMREFYNPLPGLTIASINAWESMADRGDYAELTWFWRHCWRIDVTAGSAVFNRLATLDGLQYQIKLREDKAGEPLAMQQAELLRSVYDACTNFKTAVRQLAMGLFYGFSVCEKNVTPDVVNEWTLDFVAPWFWSRDAKTRDLRFNERALSHDSQSEAVDRKRLVIFETENPIFLAIGRQVYWKLLCGADWDAALAVSANPNIFFTAREGATPEEKADLQSLANSMQSNGRGVLPAGTVVSTVDPAGQRGRMPFKERTDYCDQQIVMAATGGLLTMLSESGSGTLAGGAHSETLLRLAQGDAAMLSECLQRDIDNVVLESAFPGQPKLAYFEFEIPQPKDVSKLLEQIANLSWAGFAPDQAWLEEQTGMKLHPLNPPA